MFLREPELLDFPGYNLGVKKRMITPEGKGTSGVLVCGEASGEMEEIDQLPFRPHGEAGSVLERALYRAGVQRDSLTITNLVWYRPPQNWLDGAPWEMNAIRACKRLNDALVEEVKPKVILALGGLAFRELTGLSGAKQGIGLCRGMICDGLQYEGIPVVGAYHPSYLRRGSKERQKDPQGTQSKTESAGGGTAGMNLLGTLIRDIQLSVAIAKNGRPKFIPKDYRYSATLEDWRNALHELSHNPSMEIFYDFETRDSIAWDDESEGEMTQRDITQAQICWGQKVIVSDFFPDLLPVLRELMELPNPKIDWNGRGFDRPILRDLGIRCDLGVWHDLMDLWHHMQPDLPRGLQYATSFVCPEVGPWKHLSGSEPHYYGALDVDMPSRIWENLRGYGKTLRNPTSGVSLWDGYSLQVARLAPVLDAMTARGIPVDNAKREELGKEFDRQLEITDAQMQAIVPDELKNCEPKNGYSRNYTTKFPIEVREASGQMRLDGTQGPLSTKVVIARIEGDPPQEVKTTWITRQFRDPKKGLVHRWCKLVPFTANGADQVKRYIKWKAQSDSRYIVPIDHKTAKETTAELELQRLGKKTGDPLIPMILESREVRKAKSTYIIGWTPGKDGRVHPGFGFKPATGQLSSFNPNAQNFPQHAQIARKMRQMICARSGRKIIKFDYKSFHVLTLGFEARDATYMRMARIDMHSYFALCGLMKLEAPEKLVGLSDDELREKLAWYRASPKTYSAYRDAHGKELTFAQIRDEKAKRAILGIGFGQGGRSLYMLNQDSFRDTKEATEVIKELSYLFSLPEKWRSDVKLEGDRLTYLSTRYGFIRRFWDVFQRRIVSDSYHPNFGQLLTQDSKGRNWLLTPGDDAEACIALRPANDAFGMIREKMVYLGETGLAERYGLMLNLHDDLTFDCEDNLVEECCWEVRRILQEPSGTLRDPLVAPGGLWCEVECSMGQNWDGYDPQTNLEGMKKVKFK